MNKVRLNGTFVLLSPFAIDIQCDAQLNFLPMIDLIHLYRWIYLRCQINRRKMNITIRGETELSVLLILSSADIEVLFSPPPLLYNYPELIRENRQTNKQQLMTTIVQGIFSHYRNHSSFHR